MLELVVEAKSVEVVHVNAGSMVSVCMSEVDENKVRDALPDNNTPDITDTLDKFEIKDILDYVGASAMHKYLVKLDGV